MAESASNESDNADTRPADRVVPTIIQPPSKTSEPTLVGDASDGSISISLATTSPVGSLSKQDRSFEPTSIPEQLQGRYRFQALLGKGGFGCVYSAWDEVLQRIVAIKLARKDRFDGTEGRTQFLEEARAAAKLKHPHIVTVFDSGTDAEGNPFVVFEFIDGEPLSARMARQPLNREEVLSVIGAVANAVHAAHKAGLVHRDLKPSNILLDRNGRPHVTDFGLAVDENSQREQAGLVAGSWPYMSPEQIRGETQYLDGRTDVWSMGVMLYELLARRRPFSGRDSEELSDEILHREPKPLRQIDDAIPVELEQICLRCLSKNITSRYSSAADLAKALEFRPHAGSLGRRARMWAAGCAAVVAASLILYAVWIGRPPEDSPPRFSPPAGSDPAETKSTDPLPVVMPVPTPGKWFPLLQRRPELLVWPEDTRNSRWHYSAEDQELFVTSDQLALIKLGEVQEGDYKLQVNLFQTPWIGNVGLFFGGHTVEFDGVRCTRIQLIQLVREGERNSAKNVLQRYLLLIDDKGAVRTGQRLAGIVLPDLIARDQSLHIAIEQGALKAATWNGDPLRELNGPAFQSFLTPEDFFGELGVYAYETTATFRRPELLLIEGADRD